jgi:catechol 2,3-dioxygenase-like lactoylglutathione lyase family enzyme
MRAEVRLMPTYTRAAATLPASDLGRARKFYEEILGFKLKEDTPAGIFYEVGPHQIFLYESQYAGTNQATAATLEVSDLDAAVTELKGRGVTFEEYDIPGVKTENSIAELGPYRSAWLKDTEGNIISIGHTGS